MANPFKSHWFNITIPIAVLVGIVIFLWCASNITPPTERHVFWMSGFSGLAGVFAVFIGYYGLKYAADTLAENAHVARKQATISLVMSFNEDQRLQDLKNKIFKSAATITTDYCNLPSNEAGEKLRDEYHYVLNRYEFVALGIRSGAFDEGMYKDLQYSNFMKLWRIVNPLVQEVRRTTTKYTIYQEIEWLAKRWEKAPIVPLH